MTYRRSAAVSALGVAVLAVPAQAPAAGLTANKACYGGGDTLVLTGTGFSANGAVGLGVVTRGVNLTLADRRANAAGVFGYVSRTPFVTLQGRRTDTFTAIDRANPANRALARVLLSRVRVRVSPRRGSLRGRQRIRATGFTTGRTLYAHVRRGGRGRSMRVGRLRGACRSLTVRRRVFRRARPGTYRVQFDVARRYKRARRQRVAFRVRVLSTLRARPAAAAAAAEQWELIR